MNNDKGKELNWEDTGIGFPTPGHRRLVSLLAGYCARKRFTLIIKGSLAKGTATAYSDIDAVVAGDIGDADADEIVALYGEPVMTCRTENPPDIFIVAYADGVSMDLDLRRGLTPADLERGRVVVRFDDSFTLGGEPVRRRIITPRLPLRPDWYRTLRLIHRTAMKSLSGKAADAGELLREAAAKLGTLSLDPVELTGSFSSDLAAVYRAIAGKHPPDPTLRALLDGLVAEVASKERENLIKGE